MYSKEYYIKLRDVYTPDKIRVIFLLESPPASGKYFYDGKGKTSEPLFSAMMEYLEYKPEAKKDGLREFQKRGYLIIDSIYTPVNKEVSKTDKNRKIISEATSLIKELDYRSDECNKIILVKNNINMIYGGLLRAIGYKVLNEKPIPFPLHKWRAVFLDEMQGLKIKMKLP